MLWPLLTWQVISCHSLPTLLNKFSQALLTWSHCLLMLLSSFPSRISERLFPLTGNTFCLENLSPSLLLSSHLNQLTTFHYILYFAFITFISHSNYVFVFLPYSSREASGLFYSSLHIQECCLAQSRPFTFVQWINSKICPWNHECFLQRMPFHS